MPYSRAEYKYTNIIKFEFFHEDEEDFLINRRW